MSSDFNWYSSWITSRFSASVAFARSYASLLANRMSKVISKGPEFFDRTTDAMSLILTRPRGSLCSLESSMRQLLCLKQSIVFLCLPGFGGSGTGTAGALASRCAFLDARA